MAAATLFGLLALTANVVANPTLSPRDEYPHPSNGICTDYSVRKNITSTLYKFSFSKFESNFDVASLLYNLSTKDYATAFKPLAGTVNVTEAYEVAGTFCTPKETNGKEQTVVIATHGVAFDRRYWISSYQPEEYSFVDYILSQGYSIFYYDRIGTGQSSIVSGYTNQAQNQANFLAQLIQSLNSSHYTSAITPTKLILIGHSFGSYLTNLVIHQNPTLPISAAILTGLSYPNATDAARYQIGTTLSTFQARIASTLSPAYAAYDSGVLALGCDAPGFAETSFHAPFYAVPAVEQAFNYSVPFSVGEPLTFGLSDLSAPHFTGPVLVTTGANDLILCGGECESTFAGGLQDQIWNASRGLQTYLHEGAGHAVNFARNASGFFGVIGRFLEGV